MRREEKEMKGLQRRWDDKRWRWKDYRGDEMRWEEKEMKGLQRRWDEERGEEGIGDDGRGEERIGEEGIGDDGTGEERIGDDGIGDDGRGEERIGGEEIGDQTISFKIGRYDLFFLSEFPIFNYFCNSKLLSVIFNLFHSLFSYFPFTFSFFRIRTTGCLLSSNIFRKMGSWANLYGYNRKEKKSLLRSIIATKE